MVDRRVKAMLALGLVAAGVIVSIVGYLGVSRETDVVFQLPYFASAGVGALMLLGGGGVLFLAVELERDAERLAELEDVVRLLADEVGRLADAHEATAGVPAPTGNGAGHAAGVG